MRLRTPRARYHGILFLTRALALGVLANARAQPPAAARPSHPATSAGSLTLVTPAEPGTRLLALGTVQTATGQPVTGAELHVYQTDATGHYTRERPMDEPHARLSGRIKTDAKGRFEIRTIRPGGYEKPVRIGGQERKIPAHIHIDVTATGHAERRCQVVFADDPRLADLYWQDWVRRLDQPVLTSRSTDRGLTGTLVSAPPGMAAMGGCRSRRPGPRATRLDSPCPRYEPDRYGRHVARAHAGHSRSVSLGTAPVLRHHGVGDAGGLAARRELVSAPDRRAGRDVGRPPNPHGRREARGPLRRRLPNLPEPDRTLSAQVGEPVRTHSETG